MLRPATCVSGPPRRPVRPQGRSVVPEGSDGPEVRPRVGRGSVERSPVGWTYATSKKFGSRVSSRQEATPRGRYRSGEEPTSSPGRGGVRRCRSVAR